MDHSLFILLIGGVIVASMFVKSALSRSPIPPLVGYLGLGLALAAADGRLNFLTPASRHAFEMFSHIGLVLLLFRVGLESNFQGLAKQLKTAVVIWVFNVAVSGFAGYAAARFLLRLDLAASLLIATAFTATSVGVSAALWDEAGAVDTEDGRTMLDVAELDDISAILFMAMLFSILPALTSPQAGGPSPWGMAAAAGGLLLRLCVFGGLCVLFSLFMERGVMRYFQTLKPVPDLMIVIVGLGLAIAAAAGLWGFSLAIGAFFAGLIFSRDPEAIKNEASFLPLYELFTPFFFIGVGLSMDVSGLDAALGAGVTLTVMAAASKFAGTAVPARFFRGGRSAAILGVSMIPRAEIAMVVMARGLAMDPPAVTRQMFSAMVMVSALTCVIAPIILRRLLKNK